MPKRKSPPITYTFINPNNEEDTIKLIAKFYLDIIIKHEESELRKSLEKQD